MSGLRPSWMGACRNSGGDKEPGPEANFSYRNSWFSAIIDEVMRCECEV